MKEDVHETVENKSGWTIDGNYVWTLLLSEFQINGMLTIREAGAGEDHLPTARGAIQINPPYGLIIQRNSHFPSIQSEIAQDMNGNP